jgi:non-ribosomal peptide synthetase component F
LPLNVPLFDREAFHPDVNQLVGDFTSSILLAINASGQLSFVQRVRLNQAQFRSDAAHSAYSGVELLRDLARAQPGSTPTAASVVFTSAIGMGDFLGESVPRVFGCLAWVISQISQVWFDCQVAELQGCLLLNWDAVAQLFPAGVLDAMFGAFVRLVDWLGERPDWNVALPDMIPGDQLRVRERVNSCRRTPTGTLLHEGFFRQARQHPERLALAWGGEGSMTYGELARHARRLARILIDRGLR